MHAVRYPVSHIFAALILVYTPLAWGGAVSAAAPPKSPAPRMVTAARKRSHALALKVTARSPKVPTQPTELTPHQFGVNVSGWDPWMTTPSGVAALKDLGLGMQQFPNSPWVYNWSTNESRSQGHWHPIPVSLSQWATELTQSGDHGLYMIPYGFNRAGTAGASVSSVQTLTRWIVAHHDPITAMVIGSEQYGSWAQNFHTRKTAARYAQLSAKMAQAIHAIDPTMAVGVDFNLPANVAQPTASDRRWNRTVLRTTAPYIQFVSVHLYPLSQVQGNISLLQSLYAQVQTSMRYVNQTLQKYSAGYHISPWITEFNPYGLESAQSVHPLFGSALVQSALQLRSLGAGQIDWWSLYGNANVPAGLGSTNAHSVLNTQPGTAFASNGLLSEGIAPQPTPVNTLYPSGAAYAAMMQAIGSKAILHIDTPLYIQYHVFAAEIARRTARVWVLINDSHLTQTVTIGRQSIVLHPAQRKMVHDLTVPPVVSSPGPWPHPMGRPRHHALILRQATWNPARRILMITGSGLGHRPNSRIVAPGGGLDQAHLMITDLTTGINYGWAFPRVNSNYYGLTILDWTPTAVVVKLIGPLPTSGNRLQVSWWTPIGESDIEATQTLAEWHRQFRPSLPASVRAQIPVHATYDPQTYEITIHGTHFPPEPVLIPAPGGGDDQADVEIHSIGSTMNDGYTGPGDTNWYGVHVKQWTPTTIQLTFAVLPPYGHAISVLWIPTHTTLIAHKTR